LNSTTEINNSSRKIENDRWDTIASSVNCNSVR
jgi:hypothetical protein